MVAKSLVIGVLCAVLVLESRAQLLQVIDNNALPSGDDDVGGEKAISIFGPVNPDKSGATIDDPNLQLFGEGDDDDDGGIIIDGPVNPGKPSEPIIDGPSPMQLPAGDKVTQDPWESFYDPDNKNVFGQSFPKPEKVPDDKLIIVDSQDSNVTPFIGNNFGSYQEFTTVHYEHQSTNTQVTFPVTAAPTTQELTTTTKKPIGGLGGLGSIIFGWGKHTTQKPQTDDKNKGHGGIFGGLKDALESNKDAVQKAAESVKEAGEKVAQAGKDVLEAGLKIKGSLIPNFLGGKPKN